MKKRMLVLGLFLCFLGLPGCTSSKWLSMTEKQDRYECRFTNEKICIDGRLDEEIWQKAPKLDFFIPKNGHHPISPTEARIAWDKDYLYVGFKAYDKDIWSYLTSRDAVTCQEDVLEIFFKTNPAMAPYFNFEINALGTVYDAYNLQRGAGGMDHHRWSRWNCDRLKVAVIVQGEINNPDAADDYWQMEVAIPLAELLTLQGKIPQSGDRWLFHLARYDYSIFLPEGIELTSCTELTEANFHRYEDWMTLEFIR